MKKKETVKLLEKFVQLVKPKFPVKMVILMKAYPTDTDDILETAVIVENLEEDLLEAKDELIALAATLDPRIEPILVERDREDYAGFLKEIRENGLIIYDDLPS